MDFDFSFPSEHLLSFNSCPMTVQEHDVRCVFTGRKTFPSVVSGASSVLIAISPNRVEDTLLIPLVGEPPITLDYSIHKDVSYFCCNATTPMRNGGSAVSRQEGRKTISNKSIVCN